ncbi:hypothetical protein GCM10010425_41500 [Streptomyces spororaveus]|uniref:DUF1918 domain-containing protein n=1 Tax=Streptomyces spororaveus TaxID=284039 RepID=A0ABQ3TPC9_9ACTN|nr:hypothetical protein Sspor_78240 [Streptomyces spororaveus]
MRAQRTLLSEVTAGLSDKYPDVHVTHEVLTGHPVEEPARAAEHALAVVVGRRGRGGYTGMRLGSVGSPGRDGEVIALHHDDGTPPYAVRWSDTGRTTVFFPGPDAHVRHLHPESHVSHRMQQ